MARTNRIRITGAALLAVLAAACAGSFDGHNLEAGRATAADVVATMGEPALTLKRPDGESLLYFERYQTGPAMFVARIGADGVLRGIEQRLTWVNTHKVHADMRAEAVRELLGPPFEITNWPRQQRDSWEYPYRHAVRERRVLFVMFSYDGVVREVIDRHDEARDPESAFGGR
ncbi:MAG: hypothetical protein ACREVQ_02875 [Burkholderiales bacterium]